MTEFEKELALIQKLGLKTSPLRLEYEKKVHELRSVPERLQAEGCSEEQIARAMYEKRRELGRQYKDAAPPLFRAYIYEATAAKYGDPLGPTFEMLREKKTCRQIIESASRPIEDLDNRLTLEGFRQWYTANRNRRSGEADLPNRELRNRSIQEIKSMGYRFMQCIWGFPQIFVGSIIFLLHAKCRHYSYHGSAVTIWKSKSSLSLGMFIFVSDDPFCYYRPYEDQYTEEDFSKMLLVHEYGHTIQSLIFGPIYLLAVGAPSMAWSFCPAFVRKRARERISYFSAYPERWANHLGEKVTGETSIGEPVV